MLTKLGTELSESLYKAIPVHIESNAVGEYHLHGGVVLYDEAALASNSSLAVSNFSRTMLQSSFKSLIPFISTSCASTPSRSASVRRREPGEILTIGLYPQVHLRLGRMRY